MATCKDCLHIDVCYMVEHYGVDIEEDRQEYDCHQFQAKTNCVEVVRCKDCKHRYTLQSGHSFCREHFPLGKYDDDFCSYGERREGE